MFSLDSYCCFVLIPLNIVCMDNQFVIPTSNEIDGWVYWSQQTVGWLVCWWNVVSQASPTCLKSPEWNLLHIISKTWRWAFLESLKVFCLWFRTLFFVYWIWLLDITLTHVSWSSPCSMALSQSTCAYTSKVNMGIN